MANDGELLRRYAEAGSEAAFTELVRQHLDLVYSAALRQVNGDAHLAQDVAQTVFTDLARKAAALSRRSVLTGWLYTSTHFAAAKAVRKEQRRQAREQEAHSMRELLQPSATEPDWDRLRPALDDVMLELRESDREAILLRYFENRSLAEVGERLGVGEDGARKRVDRALEKLRASLHHRGITTVATLAGVLSANAVQVAPVGVAASVAGASLAGAAAGTEATFTALKVMSLTKLQTAIASSILVAGVATSLVVQNQFREKLRDQDRKLEQQNVQLASLESNQQHLAALASQTTNPVTNNSGGLDTLRAELAPLRKQADELAALRREGSQLQTTLAKISRDLRVGSDTNWQETTNSVELDDKIRYAMSLTLAMHEYASKHDGQFPTNFEEAMEYYRPIDGGQTNLSPAQFEILFHGNRSDIAKYAHPDRIILVIERRPWTNIDGKPVIAWSALDGAGYAYSPADGRFDQWEKQHTAPSKPTQ